MRSVRAVISWVVLLIALPIGLAVCVAGTGWEMGRKLNNWLYQ